MQITQERPQDAAAIGVVTTLAFKDKPYASHTEAKIINALRNAGALTISLVAIERTEVVGHAAFSPVQIEGRHCAWFGLGPVAVTPALQRQGIGSAIIRDGLGRLRSMYANGCVVLGDPTYYRRFGFVNDPRLRYGTAQDSPYFQCLAFTKAAPTGEVAFHHAFDIS